MAVMSYSQCGEDLQIAHLLRRTTGVHYIDVGCLWPIEHSNTFFFYERDGTGLCIDPNPAVVEEFKATRPRDIFLCAGIGAEPGRLRYRMYQNPVFNTFSEERAAFVKRRAARKRGGRLVDTVEVAVVTLDQAVRDTGFAERCNGRLDLLSIDVEGLELDVLQGFSFTELRPRLVVCEYIRRKRDQTPAAESKVARFMMKRGYWLAAYTGHDLYFLDSRKPDRVSASVR